MGLYDLLYKYNLTYNKYINLLYDLRHIIYFCSESDFETLIAKSDEIYSDKEYKKFKKQQTKQKGEKMTDFVYIVKQYQYDENIAGVPVFVFDNKAAAEKATISLNKEYSQGVIWVDGCEYLKVDEFNCKDEPHYYEYTAYKIHKDFSQATKAN